MVFEHDDRKTYELIWFLRSQHFFFLPYVFFRLQVTSSAGVDTCAPEVRDRLCSDRARLRPIPTRARQTCHLGPSCLATLVLCSYSGSFHRFLYLDVRATAFAKQNQWHFMAHCSCWGHLSETHTYNYTQGGAWGVQKAIEQTTNIKNTSKKKQRHPPQTRGGIYRHLRMLGIIRTFLHPLKRKVLRISIQEAGFCSMYFLQCFHFCIFVVSETLPSICWLMTLSR